MGYLTLIEENQLHKGELEDGLYPTVSFALGLGLIEEKREGCCGSELTNMQHDAPLIVNSGSKPLQLVKGLLNQHISEVLRGEGSLLSCNLFLVPQYIAWDSDLSLKPLQTEFF